jgi:aryl-alcohol dehydrogenase-like predicted oxidoreductase/histidinol phosphatase-like enzyme/predicted kinase
MRLSTEPERDDANSLAVLHAALDAGITLLDTADVYCRDDSERGHNERLIARALGAWEGDQTRIMLATKGGMTRPDGRWEPDGRAKHLIAACEASRRALGVDRIDLYQLHAPDPRVPLATSVRALASLKRDGLIHAIGLSNVTVGQIEEARAITDIDSIQVELSLWHDQHFLSGVAQYCAEHQLRLMAHRPLGGRRLLSRTAKDPVLAAVAARHGATPFEIALAWLADLAAVIVPLPGATRVETARSIARAAAIELSDDDRAQLDALCPAARVMRPAAPNPAPAVRDNAEIVLVMGLPGAGKTTLAQELEVKGYTRLNRDDAGGTLRGLVPALDGALAAGASHIVLDNTYVSRKARAEVVRAATARGVAVRCVWLSTSIEDAQVNAAWRTLRRDDHVAFPPTVQFRYQRELEPPEISEGFSRVEVVPFQRRFDPAYVHRAVIVWCDGILVRSRSGQRVPFSPEDVVVDVERAATLRRYQENGYRLLGLSWQPEVAEGKQSAAGVESVFARMNELLGLAIEVEYCPHAAGPPRCWCRKPLPGLGVLFIQRHHLNPAACIYVGDGPQDPGFARKLGFEYRAAGDFFTASSPESDGRG